ncbi:hypothetical protein GLAREA_10847 [Glarea lozoyensis ATCC 20868]|uniref:Uncharacterized protein n=1 Tax=Glarea lozoyensis (strain ATCC 20868 / MF5171) TaxID=1116229 RepID=S3DT62_GLAL2|nr:uncharacterized protein GLAREA_10847 [Glarea lozoyensis ATCC 20868]EPE35151.1 hypothetical protein GLAREA_10847 [Glarea lozoyensis ATCC 20868]
MQISRLALILGLILAVTTSYASSVTDNDVAIDEAQHRDGSDSSGSAPRFSGNKYKKKKKPKKPKPEKGCQSGCNETEAANSTASALGMSLRGVVLGTGGVMVGIAVL